jgi:hypothetical protein
MWCWSVSSVGVERGGCGGYRVEGGLGVDLSCFTIGAAWTFDRQARASRPAMMRPTTGITSHMCSELGPFSATKVSQVIRTFTHLDVPVPPPPAGWPVADGDRQPGASGHAGCGCQHGYAQRRRVGQLDQGAPLQSRIGQYRDEKGARHMRATVMYGARDVRLETLPDPQLSTGDDAIVRVVAACVCGSDLRQPSGQDPGCRALCPMRSAGGARVRLLILSCVRPWASRKAPCTSTRYSRSAPRPAAPAASRCAPTGNEPLVPQATAPR